VPGVVICAVGADKAIDAESTLSVWLLAVMTVASRNPYRTAPYLRQLMVYSFDFTNTLRSRGFTTRRTVHNHEST
jgi:hypothetical protein